MNNKGFTLVELIAVLVLLGLIVGITLPMFGINFGQTKEKTEEVFVDTIKDALKIYLTSKEAKSLLKNSEVECSNKLHKLHGDIKVYWVNTNFQSVIDSEYKPITQKDLVNPADKDNSCNNASNIDITIYRDSDYVYYYKVDKDEFDCLNNNGGEYDEFISNLPEGFIC